CVAFAPGDSLMVWGAPSHRELAVAVAGAAYRAGADWVEHEVTDPRLTAARILHGSEDAIGAVSPMYIAGRRALAREKTALVQVHGEFEPQVLAALPPDRVAEDTRKRQAKLAWSAAARRQGRLRGTICAWPTPEWAALVYPELESAKAQRRLARDILSFCRIGPQDPPGHKGWTQHLATLRRRAARLTKLELRELRIRDRGTDLRLRIVPNSMWRGGGEQTAWGHQIAMNVPTEECFVSPDAAATEGTFRCSRPRSFGGRVIEDLSGEFRGGRLVRLKAKREADRDWLARYLGAIPNADRLGEIALVDASSRIGRTGLVYYNGLLDENAAAHMAFGSGFAKTRSISIAKKRYGVNRSKTHIDVMIGSDLLEADGITHSGKRVPLVTDGTWCF
ncbi:MAG: aminopeptidase, partial [Gaiellaceae bacterium]|nr:aminopeptidase [Gaiellaceae bacterium]